MAVYPIMLEMSHLPVVVIGGGDMADWKVETLRAADAQVTVVSPVVGPRLRALANLGHIVWLQRFATYTDIEQARLTIIATDDKEEQSRTIAWAKSSGTLLNVVDQPDHCDFYSTSHFRRGDLVVSLSTSGQAPALAAELRHALEEIIGPQWANQVRDIAALRRSKRPPSEIKEVSRQMAIRLRKVESTR